jgi:hypothetical protein
LGKWRIPHTYLDEIKWVRERMEWTGPLEDDLQLLVGGDQGRGLCGWLGKDVLELADPGKRVGFRPCDDFRMAVAQAQSASER